MEIVYPRVAAIDVGKKEIAVTVRVPGQGPGTRTQHTRKFRTFYQVLRQMVGWLIEQEVTHVAMEATGVYWKPVFHALCETDTLDVVLVNARHVKNVPGRKTDVRDSEWLAQLLECGLLRGSFIPPPQIAAIRELTRYRKKTIQARTRELQRLTKVFEDAGIKIETQPRPAYRSRLRVLPGSPAPTSHRRRLRLYGFRAVRRRTRARVDFSDPAAVSIGGTPESSGWPGFSGSRRAKRFPPASQQPPPNRLARASPAGQRTTRPRLPAHPPAPSRQER